MRLELMKEDSCCVLMLFDMKVMRLCSSAVVQKCQLQDYNMATSFLLTMKTIAWCGSGEPRTSILDSP